MTATPSRLALLALLVSVLLPIEAQAISRVETMGRTCGQVKALLENEGAAILRYPSKRNTGMMLYDRYVANRHACLMGEITQRATVPTRDTGSCPVLKCHRPDYDDEFRIRPMPLR